MLIRDMSKLHAGARLNVERIGPRISPENVGDVEGGENVPKLHGFVLYIGGTGWSDFYYYKDLIHSALIFNPEGAQGDGV